MKSYVFGALAAAVLISVVCVVLVQGSKSEVSSGRSSDLTTSTSSKLFTFDSFLPDRLQWLSNSGYCGEVSVQMALLKFGSYMSEYDVRAISAIAPNNVQKKHFYLVGENDERASKLLKLSAIEWDYNIRRRHIWSI